MVKMRALRAHSSTLWGSPVDGEVFDVPEGYVEGIEEAGLAERVSTGHPVKEIGSDPGVVSTPGVVERKPSVDETIADLNRTITSEQVSTGKRRGRPRKS